MKYREWDSNPQPSGFTTHMVDTGKTVVMYIKTKSVHFDAMTITVVMVGKICTFFLWEGQGHFWIRIKFHLGREKEGIRGGMGKKPKMRVIFTKFPLFSKI